MRKEEILQGGERASAIWQCHTSSLPRILVVDDEPLIRQLNTEVLLESGYEVDAAEDGAVAWETLQHSGYDLLITDNDMPNVSGVDLLKKLCAARIPMPVIMVTGTFPQDEFARYPWLQPAATLLKPYTLAELLGAVKKILRASNGDREQLVSSGHPSPYQCIPHS